MEAGELAQVVVHLPSTREVMSSNSSTAKKKSVLNGTNHVDLCSIINQKTEEYTACSNVEPKRKKLC
jgi:hypothetical protein